eukprot:11216755-Lingulodinium_polyedra.AAC.1
MRQAPVAPTVLAGSQRCPAGRACCSGAASCGVRPRPSSSRCGPGCKRQAACATGPFPWRRAFRPRTPVARCRTGPGP